MGIIKKNKKQQQQKMRFAALATAFLTYTTAIKLEQVPQEQTLVQAFAQEEGDFGFPMKLDELFKAVDANGDGALTMKEICGAIRKFAKEHDIKLPKGWRKVSQRTQGSHQGPRRAHGCQAQERLVK